MNRNRFLALIVCGAILTALLCSLQAQQTSGNSGLTVPNGRDTSYFDPPFRSLKKTDIFGREFTPDKSGKMILVKEARIDSYRLIAEKATNELAMIIEAPEAQVDTVSHEARSSGPLKIRSGDGRLLIKGVGFLLKDTSSNMVLTISNEVSTTIKSNAVNSPSGQTNIELGRAIDIHSSYMVIDRTANLITYNRNVRANNDQFDMTCDVLNIRLQTNGSGVQEIVADGNVVMSSLGGGGTVTGARAVMVTTKTGNLVTLTGEPHWRDGLREGTAETFYYETGASNVYGISNIFRAEKDAHFRLPQDSLSSGTFELMPFVQTNTAIASTNAAGTNFVDLTAENVVLLLPPTNGGAILGMIANNNVVILDPAREGRATGDRATYTATNGVMELAGNSKWISGKESTSAEVLRYDKLGQTFTAESNAWVRLPATSMSDVVNPTNSVSGRVAATNLFLEVRSANYDFTNSVLTFHNQVKAVLLEGDVPRATLDCDTLTVTMLGKIIQRIVAESNVVGHQLPSQDIFGRVIEREIKCDTLAITVRTNRLLEQMAASGSCKAIQISTTTNRALPVRFGSAADKINIFFRADTNAVDHAIADGRVVFIREDKTLRGDHAVYTATNDTSVLSGHPSSEAPGALFTAQDVMVYNHTTGDINASDHISGTILLDAETMGKMQMMGGPRKKAK